MAIERHTTSTTDVVMKLILVFFISLLSFSIGTYVGKKFSDNQHKIAHFEPGTEGAPERSVASVNEEHPTAEAGAHDATPAAVPSDEEVRKLAAEFVSDEVKPEGTSNEHGEDSHGEASTHGAAPAHGEKVAAHAEKDEHEASAHNEAKDEHEAPVPAAKPAHGVAPVKVSAHEPSDEAARLAVGHTPTPVAKAVANDKKSRIPAELPKQVAASPIGKFTVQVSAQKNEEDAKKAAEELTAKGYSAFYVAAKVRNETYYRVSVGLFETEKEAKSYRKEFMAKEKLSSSLVQKITN